MCTLIQYLGFMSNFFVLLLSWMFQHDWTPAVLSVLYACVLYFCICTCSAQLNMFHMERRSRNMLILLLLINNTLLSLNREIALGAANRLLLFPRSQEG